MIINIMFFEFDTNLMAKDILRRRILVFAIKHLDDAEFRRLLL